MQSNEKIENSAKENQAQDDRIDDLSYPQWMPRGLFKAIGPISLVVLVVAAAVAFYAHEHVTRDSVRLQFWIGFMFSFTALVVVTVQVVIYAQQAEFMKRQAGIMDDMLGEARRTRETDNRAYLGVKAIGLERAAHRPGESNIVITFINTGKAPATGWINIVFLLSDDSPPDGYDLALHLKSTAPPVKLVFLPQVEVFFTTHDTIPDETFIGPATPEQQSRWRGFLQPVTAAGGPIEPGKAKLLVVGTIVYEDVFKNVHTTRFCYCADNQGPHSKFKACRTHNSFD